MSRRKVSIMWRNVLIAMLTLRMLLGSVVCCCTLSAWTTSFSGKAANASCCCTQPTNDSSEDPTPAQPKPSHQCPCHSGTNVMANSESDLFNFESLRIASWLDKLDLPASLAESIRDGDLNKIAIPADASAGPFARFSGTEILRLLQTMRC